MKKISFRYKNLTATLLLSCLILFVGAELVSRAIGLKPIQPCHFANEPIVHIPDPVLG